jgi:type II secretory pathway pseudopilin PulG
MIILGILAAIAYAVFLGQREKANDAASKDHAAALALQVQSCFTEHDSYANCRTEAEMGETGLPFDDTVTIQPDCNQDPGPSDSYDEPDTGRVAVTAASTDCYLIEAVSRDGHQFWILKRTDATAIRGCLPPGQGGCETSSDPAIGAWSKG